ncbi:MAG: DNA polymerase Y family protein [Gammaproteobacteria bacterium]|nr:MAG: DNA polymerase Y family protein [Gammaproteobacteria bacterium]
MPSSPASLPLFPTSPDTGKEPARPEFPSPSAPFKKQLWLCLDFYRLPLEVFSDSDPGRAFAVLEGEGGGLRICQCNEQAARDGLHPELPLNAALALSPALEIRERAPDREAEALNRLAAWACQFTDMVSIDSPYRLLLEIHGSLKLFGGLASLCRQARLGVMEMGYTSALAVAPTPRAALWLSNTRRDDIVTELALLPDRLSELPIVCTDWPQTIRERLDAMGVLTIGDCLRLPREGFARRLGPKRLKDLDAALGRCAEARHRFVVPPVYHGELELLAETLDHERLCRAMARLVEEMQGFLRGWQKGVQRPVFAFVHGDGTQRLALGLAEPSADAAFILDLLAERLENYRLEQPVTDLALDSGLLADLPGSPRGLFADTEGTGRDAVAGRRLVDRLRARLGKEAVNGVCLLAEHRPEAAWRFVEPGAGCGQAGNPGRPFWILQDPRELSCRDGRPWLEGVLEIVEGPERIETGWWDGRDAARDYYVARNQTGVRVWIYQERRSPEQWFLHGVFG